MARKILQSTYRTEQNYIKRLSADKRFIIIYHHRIPVYLYSPWMLSFFAKLFSFQKKKSGKSPRKNPNA